MVCKKAAKRGILQRLIIQPRMGCTRNLYVHHCTHSFIFGANKQKNKKLTIVNIAKAQKIMDNILPDFILADLYPNSLVLVERNETAQQEAVAPMVKAAQPQKWFLGNNGKKISILVKEPDAVYL